MATSVKTKKSVKKSKKTKRVSNAQKVKKARGVKKTQNAKLSKSQKRNGDEAPKLSITKALYQLFEEKGCENVTVEEATVLARSIKKDTKFNRWHLYFHRRKFRVEVLGYK